MAEKLTAAKLAEAVRSRNERDRFLAMLSVMMVVVALLVVHTVMRQGIAMTHKETILDCHYEGNGAHKHTAECYDKGANLVCPLQERELHIHDDSCYTVEQVLVCDLEEGPDHTHTDECFETVKILTCGKEEVTEEHVHGAGCFKTVTVRDSDGKIIEVDEDHANIEGLEFEEAGDDAAAQEELQAQASDDELGIASDEATSAEETAGTPEEEGQQDPRALQTDKKPEGTEGQDAASAAGDEDGQDASTVETVDAEGKTHRLVVADDAAAAEEDPNMPAQNFDKVVKDARGNVLVRVIVYAPAGAFPAGTTMRVVPVSTNDVSDAIEGAVSGKTDRKVANIQAVDITFYDADGKEIEPAKKLSVKMTSDLIGAKDEPMVVHVDERGDADVVDTTTGTDADLLFDEDRF